MNIMNQLTRKHMKNNKKRTIMTILGVIVSVAMITAVATGANSFTAYIQQIQMQSSGSWHVKYEDITMNHLEEVEKDSNTKNVFYTQDGLFGLPIDAKTKLEQKPFLYLQAYTKEATEEMHVIVKNGRLPENEGEIAIPSHLKFQDNVSYEIGDTITLEVGERYTGEYAAGHTLSQDDEYRKDDVDEEFHIDETKSYIITGIIDEPGYEDYSSPGYTCITYLNSESLAEESQVTAYLYINKVTKQIYKDYQEKGALFGLAKGQVKFNSDVLTYYGVTHYESFNRMLEILEIVLLIIIMIGSISLIYNSFAISITERSKQLGMLSSVGATKQQKRNSVFFEGTMIGFIAIPIGILAGIGGIGVTFALVGPILSKSFRYDLPLKLCVSYESILIAIIFSIITIFVSAYIPAMKASRISAIDAIRQTQDIRISGKTVRTRRWVRRVFGLEGELALKNLKRNKRRFRALVFSLFISLVLFISVSSYVFYVTKGADMAMGSAGYDISIYFPLERPEKGLLDQLREVEGIKNGLGITSYSSDIFIPGDYVEQHITEQCKKVKRTIYERYGYSESEIKQHMESNNTYGVNFVVLDDSSFKDYRKELDIKGTTQVEESDIFNGILVNRHKSQIGYSMLEAEIFDVLAGDEIPITYRKYQSVLNEEGEESYVSSDEMNLAIKLLGVADTLPLGINYSDMDSPMIVVVDRDTMEQIQGFMTGDDLSYASEHYYFTVDREQGIDERLEEVLTQEGDGVTYYSYNVIAKDRQNRQLLMVLSVFAYGFIALISLICIANLCNTISTSFMLRRREFAMLKSVGMTPKAFHRMIYFESLFYGLKALAYGLPVSIVITCKEYSIVNDNFMSEFTFPWKTYLIGVLAVFVVVLVAMRYASNKIKDESIIEGLKSEIDR